MKFTLRFVDGRKRKRRRTKITTAEIYRSAFSSSFSLRFSHFFGIGNVKVLNITIQPINKTTNISIGPFHTKLQRWMFLTNKCEFNWWCFLKHLINKRCKLNFMSQFSNVFWKFSIKMVVNSLFVVHDFEWNHRINDYLTFHTFANSTKMLQSEVMSYIFSCPSVRTIFHWHLVLVHIEREFLVETLDEGKYFMNESIDMVFRPVHFYYAQPFFCFVSF